MALTRDDVFWNAFTAHAKLAEDATALLEEMLAKPEKAAETYAKIERLESEGDKITHEVVVTLHQTWITPLDREWIHGLITLLDDVLDFVDSAGERFTLYELKAARPDAIELAKVLRAAAADMSKAVAALPKLKDAPALLELCGTISKHERQADRLYRRALAALFKDGAASTAPGAPPYRADAHGVDALEVMKWRDVLDSLEASCDRIEDVAQIIEGIVLEHA